MDNIPKIILENPFRILGVYANSPKKDVVSNKAKATAFLKVNKTVEYPLDLKGLMPVPNRTLDVMNEAEAHLAIAKEQIKYVQFWFMKITPIDDIAFNHLVAGNISQAEEMWAKQESISSLQNKIVCYLIGKKPLLALKTAERLYDKFGDAYINKVDANSTLQMSGTELLHQFIDLLGENLGMAKLQQYDLSDSTKAYISSQTVGPLISKISTEVDKTKKVDHKDHKARIEAARKLVANTKEDLKLLREILPETDSQYQMIADKLGLEILQCGIDYFNNSEEDGRHQTAMKMQKHAQSIVVGALAKKRCEENVRILQDMIDKLPPEQIIHEYNLLLSIIADFVNPPKKETQGIVTILGQSTRRLIDDIVGPTLPDNSMEILSFIKRIRPLVVAMKEKVSRNESHYVEICTLIGNIAIGKSVDSLNKAQNVIEMWGKKAANNPYDILYSRNYEAVKHYNLLLIKFKSMVSDIWEALLEIELMDVSGDFRTNRLKPNKSALKSISVSLGLSLTNTAKDPTLFYTEEDCFRSCKTYSSYTNYIKKFPKGKYCIEAKRKMVAIEKQEFEKRMEIFGYEDFIRKYPKSQFVQKAREKIDSIKQEIIQILASTSTVKDCCSLYKKYRTDPGGKIDEKAYSLCKTYEDLTAYVKTFTNRRDDAQRRIKEIESKRTFIFIGIAIAVTFLLLIIILANSN